VPVISHFFGIMIRMFYREHGGSEPRRGSLSRGSLRWTEEVLMEFLPMVVRAEYRGGYKICLAFNDGVEGTVDFSDWLAGPVFEALKEREQFERFFLDGGTVAWPNGADIAPETLYERARSSKAA
jgi:hypothetical protein